MSLSAEPYSICGYGANCVARFEGNESTAVWTRQVLSVDRAGDLVDGAANSDRVAPNLTLRMARITKQVCTNLGKSI